MKIDQMKRCQKKVQRYCQIKRYASAQVRRMGRCGTRWLSDSMSLTNRYVSLSQTLSPHARPLARAGHRRRASWPAAQDDDERHQACQESVQPIYDRDRELRLYSNVEKLQQHPQSVGDKHLERHRWHRRE